MKNNLPFSMFNRIDKLVTNEMTKKERINEMKKWLKDAFYPEGLINGALEKLYNNKKKEEKRKPESINFISTYNPNAPDLKPIINTCLNFLKINDQTKTTFKNKKIINCYQQNSNLKHILSKAKFTENLSNNLTKIQKCNRPRCGLCIHLIETNEIIMENGKTFKINTSMKCNSKNLIYMIKCSKCPKTYIGETSDLLSNRMTVHRQQIKDKNLRHLQVSIHIAECAQDNEIQFFVIPLVKIIKEDTDLRKSIEIDLIHKYNPSLNRKNIC